MNGTFGSYRRSEVNHTFNDDGRKITVKPGDRVFCSFVGAARDPKVFPDPDTVRVDRPLDSYIHYGIGPHTCLGKDASMVALTAMLRVVGRMEGLRRAPGPQGQLKKVKRDGGFYGRVPTNDWMCAMMLTCVPVYMKEDHGSMFVFRECALIDVRCFS